MNRIVFCMFTACLVALGSRPAAAYEESVNTVATFSIVACDTARGEWGVAVASRFLGVGGIVPWAQAGVGAVATQAVANTSFGPDGLRLLSADYAAPKALDRLLHQDSQPAIRQIGIVDRNGDSATYTGSRCLTLADGVNGPGFAIQGNALTSVEVLTEMADTFTRHAEKSLAERMLLALEAGQLAGGDQRGRQAAAILVVKKRGGYGGHNDRYLDLRVDDHKKPIAELRRIYAIHARALLPATHVRLGDEAKSAGRLEDANIEYSRSISLYRDAILKYPDDPKPSNALAWFYVQHNMNIDEAWAMARKAYSMDPESWKVLDTLAELYYVTGNTGKAHKAAVAALERAPENTYLKQQEQRFRNADSERHP